MPPRTPARPQPRVDPKSRPGAAPGSLGAQWHGLPVWAWTGIGVVTLAGAYLFIKRYKASKAAGSGTAPMTSGTGAPLGTSASWGGGSLPLLGAPGGGALPPGTPNGTTTSTSTNPPVPAGSPSLTYVQPPTVSAGLPPFAGPGGPANETQAPGVASSTYSNVTGQWIPLVPLGTTSVGTAYGPPPPPAGQSFAPSGSSLGSFSIADRIGQFLGVGK